MTPLPSRQDRSADEGAPMVVAWLTTIGGIRCAECREQGNRESTDQSLIGRRCGMCGAPVPF